MKLHIIHKKIGQTPLEALERLRKKLKISKSASLTYAGRLDPMASGVLLILESASQADREKYLGLDKVYEAKILLGFTTDTWDLLGMPKIYNIEYVTCNKELKWNACSIPLLSKERLGEVSLKSIQTQIKKYLGTVKLPIPLYSSVPYEGKPLFEWARSGKISEKNLPKREMKVRNIKFNGIETVSPKKLLKYIQT
ncbi:MAG: hypothetical protein JNN11_01090, partial [Candidatus Doudnabacteria bacterium]|nr:hypothetical protein [Candidatus Doudnabacteria bacterium]